MKNSSVASAIKEFCEDNDIKYYGDYSGRSMYGRTCVGIVCDNILYVLVKLCDYLRDINIDSVENTLGSIRTDSMGRQSILYFTGVHEEDENSLE